MSEEPNEDLGIDEFAGKWPDGVILQVLESEPADGRQDEHDASSAVQQARGPALKDRLHEDEEAGRLNDTQHRQRNKRDRDGDSGSSDSSADRRLSRHSSGKRSRQSALCDSALEAERTGELGMPVRVNPAAESTPNSAPQSAPDPATQTDRSPVGDVHSQHGDSLISDWGEFCRICHESGEKVPLVTACRCTGSMQHVHNECLIRWILSSFNTHCEICLHRYRIGTTGMRMPHQWKLPVTDGVERYHMLLCMVALVVLAGVISFLIYVSTDEGREARTYRNSPLAPALYAVYAVLGLVCLGLATAELHYTVCPLIERFRLTNMNLLVVPYDPDECSVSSMDQLSAEYVTV